VTFTGRGTVILDTFQSPLSNLLAVNSFALRCRSSDGAQCRRLALTMSIKAHFVPNRHNSSFFSIFVSSCSVAKAPPFMMRKRGGRRKVGAHIGIITYFSVIRHHVRSFNSNQAATNLPNKMNLSNKMWFLSISRAEEFDAAIADRWKADMDGILIYVRPNRLMSFATLYRSLDGFSAMVAAFLILSYMYLKPDSGEMSRRDVLYASSRGYAGTCWDLQ